MENAWQEEIDNLAQILIWADLKDLLTEVISKLINHKQICYRKQIITMSIRSIISKMNKWAIK